MPRAGPDQFRKWHEANGRAPFSPALNTQLEASYRDPGLPLKHRIMAWLIRHAWGNYSDVAVNGDGRPWRLADCARDLNAQLPHVNTTIRALAQYVRTESGSLRLVPDPVAGGAVPSTNAGSYAAWFGGWLTEHPSELERLNSAQAIEKEVRSLARRDYRQAKKNEKAMKARNVTGNGNKMLRESVTNDPGIIIDRSRSKKGEAAGRQALLLDAIEPLCSLLADHPTLRLLDEIEHELGDCPPDLLGRAIGCRIGRIRSLGILPHLARAVRHSYRKPEESARGLSDFDFTEQQLAAMLEEETREDLRECLRDMIIERRQKHGVQSERAPVSPGRAVGR